MKLIKLSLPAIRAIHTNKITRKILKKKQDELK